MGNCQTISEEGGKKTSSKYGGKPHIFIKTFTWARDSHGLFDYESKNLTKKNMKTNNPGKIMRQGNDLRLAKDNEKQLKEEKELLKLILKDGQVLVDTCKEPIEKPKIRQEESLENIDYDLWLVVKSMKTNANSKGYKLTEGDLIKLGRVKFRIRELKGTETKASKGEKHTKIEEDNVSIGESDKKSVDSAKLSQGSMVQTCRICLSETPEPGDPFFSPCHCTGTMKYIHIKCLQQWLKSKLHIKQSNNSTSVYWKTLECELCKTPYPTFFIVDQKRYDIVEFDKPDCPYIILDILSKEKGITRGIHVIKMENKNNIRLGRGHESDIRITDISVSRCHAFIKLEKGEFYIDDNNSKFGTLVHLKKAFSIPVDIPDVSLQVGRTVVSLTVKKSRKFFSACFSSSTGGDHNTSQDQRISESEESSDSEQEPQNNEAVDNGESPRIHHQATNQNRSSPVSRVEDFEEEENEAPVGQNENNQSQNQSQNQNQVQIQIQNRNQIANQNQNQVENNINEVVENQEELEGNHSGMNMNNIDLNVEVYVSRDNLDQSPSNQLEQLEQLQTIQVNNNAAINNPVQQVTDHFNDCDGPVD